MRITPKQSQLCLHSALSYFLHEWKQPDATLWRSLQDIHHDYPDAPVSDYEATLGMVVAGRSETMRIDDLVTAIEDLHYAHCRLVEEVLVQCATAPQELQKGDKA